MKEENYNKRFLLLFSMAVFVCIVIGAAYAYLMVRTDSGAEASAKVVTRTASSLMFETVGDILIEASEDNFSETSGNVFSSTLATAKLRASNADEEEQYTYNVYVDISSNDFEYTTVDKKAELILKVTDPTNKLVTSIDGLTYNADLGGFDITEYEGLIEVATNYVIKGLNNTVTQTWIVEIIFVNLETSQNQNLGKEFVGEVIVGKEAKENAVKKLVEETLADMTLEEKIAQMTIISFEGTSMNSSLTQDLALKPGGVIFFAGNITNYANTKSFIESIQATADIPMFISVDQEGGRVQRIKSSVDSRVQTIPPMRTVGYKNNPQLAYNLGKVIAEEILAFGFNMDFAPDIDVVDVTSTNVIGDRSFGGNPALVSSLGTAMYNGILDKGVIPSYKHFPGHGATDKDTHTELPVLSQTKQQLLQRDLIPFQYVIDHGAKLIMVGHLSIPNIDPDGYPASLSKSLITDLLKEEMGFKGLVITDSLQMGAITDNYPEKQRYELAINAGVDILLMPTNFQNAITYIKESVNEGTIDEDRIDESVRKILTLKYTKLSTEALSEEYLGSAEHISVIESINAN